MKRTVALAVWCAWGAAASGQPGGPTPPGTFPAAVAAETAKVRFHVAAPQHDGAFAEQTRAALTELFRKDRDATFVKLRVFAAGADDLAAAEPIVREMFETEKRPLPALSLLGVAGFPVAGQRVVVESTTAGTGIVNPSGVALLAGLASPAGDRTIAGLATVAGAGGIANDQVLRVSCFYESPDQVASAQKAIAELFPSAESSFVYSYAAASPPLIECEGVARMTAPAVEGVRIFNLPGAAPSPNFSRGALVSTARLVFTGTLVARGDAEPDLRLMFEQTKTAVERLNATLPQVVMGDNYWLSAAARDRLRLVRATYLGGTVPAATGVFFNSLPGAGATAAIELVIAPR